MSSANWQPFCHSLCLLYIPYGSKLLIKHQESFPHKNYPSFHTFLEQKHDLHSNIMARISVFGMIPLAKMPYFWYMFLKFSNWGVCIPVI